ncbi:MAG: thermonuclease family protein [bacterium]
MHIKYEKYIVYALLLVGAISYALFSYIPNRELRGEFGTVKYVIDGDTIQLTDGRTVRYIGIDAPETQKKTQTGQCFADESTNANKKLVNGAQIRMAKDISNKDKYGRLLRYVYVDNIFVNQYLVENGFAIAKAYLPDVYYKQEFKSAQEKSKTEKKGLWADNACTNQK